MNKQPIDLSKIVIRSGNHVAPSDPLDPTKVEACVMEWVYLTDCLERGVSVDRIIAGWSDRPPCSSPVVTRMLIRFNDMVTDDQRRTRVLRQLIDVVRKSGGGSVDLESRRQWLAVDWSLRSATPSLLRIAGLETQAAALDALGEIRGRRDVIAARCVCSAAREAATALRRAKFETLRALVRERMPKAAEAATVSGDAALSSLLHSWANRVEEAQTAVRDGNTLWFAILQAQNGLQFAAAPDA
jgi:hypothetical protein